MVNRDFVNIQVDRTFFNQYFEPSRKKVQNQLGTKITQKQFTAMLGKNKISLDISLKAIGGKNARSKKQKR